MPCEFAINGNCQVSTDMAGIPVPLHEGACRACLSRPDAKRVGNHVVTDRACWALLQAGQRQKAETLRLAEIGLKELTPKQLELKRRVREANSRSKRLISWLRLFALPGDRGIGDTAQRLIMRSCKSPDARAALERLLQQCSCSRTDAVDRLNREYPYEQ